MNVFAGMHGDYRKKSVFIEVTSSDSGEIVIVVIVLLESNILNIAANYLLYSQNDYM